MHVTKGVRLFFLQEQLSQRCVVFNFSSTLGGGFESYRKDETLNGEEKKRTDEKLWKLLSLKLIVSHHLLSFKWCDKETAIVEQVAICLMYCRRNQESKLTAVKQRVL